MRRYLTSLPIWTVGVARIIKRGLLAATLGSALQLRPELAFVLYLLREMVDEFIIVREGVRPSPPPTDKKDQ